MMTMIKRVLTLIDTAELLVDKINDFIKNELNEDEYVMDIKYIKDVEQYIRSTNGTIEPETVVVAILHIGELK